MRFDLLILAVLPERSVKYGQGTGRAGRGGQAAVDRAQEAGFFGNSGPYIRPRQLRSVRADLCKTDGRPDSRIFSPQRPAASDASPKKIAMITDGTRVGRHIFHVTSSFEMTAYSG